MGKFHILSRGEGGRIGIDHGLQCVANRLVMEAVRQSISILSQRLAEFAVKNANSVFDVLPVVEEQWLTPAILNFEASAMEEVPACH